MKFILYGNHSISYTSESHHALSLEALGHTVIRLQETTVTTEEVLRQSLDSDGLIWIHSHGFINQGNISMLSVLQTLKERNIPTMAYHLDLYMGLERWKEYEGGTYFKVQHFFTVDKLMAEWLNGNTETKGHYLPAGVLESETYVLDMQKKYDVVFVGSRGYHPEWPYRSKLIDWLRATYKDRFYHFGNDGLGVKRGRELNEVYAQSRVIVGDTLCPGFTYPWYFSDRVFETLGRGGFIIHPYIYGIENLFNINTELITYTYNNFRELKQKIDFFIENEDSRETIRKAGHERVLKEHTYRHRWSSIIKTIYDK